MAMNITDFPGLEVGAFMVEPISSWSVEQMLLFPILFIIPAEILGLINDALIYFCEFIIKRKGLPGKYNSDPSFLPSLLSFTLVSRFF